MMYSEAPFMPTCPPGEQLPVDRISPRGSLRQLQEHVSLAALADSIRCCGLLRPVIVRRTGTGRYVIVSGNRRLMACRMLGMTYIPARVLRDDAAWQTAGQLLDTLLSRRMHYLEEAEMLRTLHRQHGMSWEELAGLLLTDGAALERQTRLTGMADETKALLMEEAVPMGIALQLLRVPDGERQHVLAQRISDQRLCIRDAALLVTAELRQMTRTEAAGNAANVLNGVNNGMMRRTAQRQLNDEDGVNNGKSEGEKRRVIRVVRDERLYINAIRDIAGQMQAAGVKAILAERWTGGQVELIIRVPTRRRRMERYQSASMHSL